MGRQIIKNSGKGNLVEKVKRKIRNTWVSKLRNTCLYKYCYKSYWHFLLTHERRGQTDNLYFAARPNPGAGIGHQMANWIAGFWYAQQFGLKFVHIPFSSKKWEYLLGFYQGEETVENLKNKGYKVVRIQSFDENNAEEMNRVKKIINSYADTKTIFLAEQDQFYHDQYGVMDQIQDKFYSASARKNDKLIYETNNYNIAIHIRRGDIVQKNDENNPNLKMRFQGNGYFVSALKSALKYIETTKDIHIYLFSQGEHEDFSDFNKFDNIHLCIDMGAQDSFIHMVYADALITSRSSFSYKPALLNRGIKFSPANFWHGYPDDKNWILLDENGDISEEYQGT